MKRFAYITLGLFLFSGLVYAAATELSVSSDTQECVSNSCDPTVPTISGDLNLNSQYLIYKEDLPYNDTSDASLHDGGAVTGKLISTLWGDFDFSYSLVNEGLSLQCGDGVSKTSVKLKMTGVTTATSSFWPGYTLTSGYYCPFKNVGVSAGTIVLNFASSELGNISFSAIPSAAPTPSSLKGLAFNGLAVLSSEKISASKNITDNVNYLETTVTKFDAKTAINKNISTILAGVTTPDTSLSLNGSKKFQYFTDDVTISSDVTVSGKNTVIVKGGDVHINGDMKYADNQSMLVLVVKKDGATGGNIYINGSVTNVIGTLIADGAILGDAVKNKQLLIYGSIFTNNTIGGSVNASSLSCPFGVTCNQTNANKYDLARIRDFTVIPAKFITNGTCYVAGSDVLVPTAGNTTNGLTGAWAGKKNCKNTDPTTGGLMGTTRVNPFVIEYNPYMITADMPILRTR